MTLSSKNRLLSQHFQEAAHIHRAFCQRWSWLYCSANMKAPLDTTKLPTLPIRHREQRRRDKPALSLKGRKKCNQGNMSYMSQILVQDFSLCRGYFLLPDMLNCLRSHSCPESHSNLLEKVPAAPKVDSWEPALLILSSRPEEGCKGC